MPTDATRDTASIAVRRTHHAGSTMADHEPTTAALRDHRVMTLTEFLLARIGDDERAATDARSRAECEAKRRIVEIHAYVGDDCAGHPGPWMPHDDYGTGYCKRGDENVWELRHLAAIYADHPDYRPEWKP